MARINFYTFFLLFAISFASQAAPDNAQLAVWANEAIVATYTFDYKNFLIQQKQIAHYFTAEGWTAYSNALIASKLPETIKTNSYQVSAVATSPPELKSLSANQWQAKMSLLVVFKNPQYQQKQTLEVTMTFTEAPQGQGVRGLAITSLQAKASEPPCQCPSTEKNPTSNGQQSSQDATRATSPTAQ